MSWVRILILVSSAITAVVDAIRVASDANTQVTGKHLLAVGAVALFAWASRSPWDVSKAEAERRVTEARNSIVPKPPLYLMLCVYLSFQTLTGCTGTIEQRTRTALDALDAVAGPASEAALKSCDALEFADKCQAARDAITVIDALRREARKQLEAGHVEEAREAIKDAQKMVAALRWML
jgi:hypothetical protein